MNTLVDLIKINFYIRCLVGFDVAVIDIRIAKFIRFEGDAVEA